MKHPEKHQAVSQYSTATMPTGSMGVLTVVWEDAGGNAVPVDGPTAWASTDPSIVAVSGPGDNDLSCNILAVGPLGQCQVQASADADLGGGVTAVTAVIDITVIAGQAVSGEITFTPTGQHPPARQ